MRIAASMNPESVKQEWLEYVESLHRETSRKVWDLRGENELVNFPPVQIN